MAQIGEGTAYDCGVFLEWGPVHAENDATGAVFEVYADPGYSDVILDVKPQSEEIDRCNVSMCLTPDEAQELSEQLNAAAESIREEASA